MLAAGLRFSTAFLREGAQQAGLFPRCTPHVTQVPARTHERPEEAIVDHGLMTRGDTLMARLLQPSCGDGFQLMSMRR